MLFFRELAFWQGCYSSSAAPLPKTNVAVVKPDRSLFINFFRAIGDLYFYDALDCAISATELRR